MYYKFLSESNMKCLLISFLSLSLCSGYCDSEVLVKDFKFKNTDCLLTNTCDLMSFSVKIFDYTLLADKKYHGAKAFLSYKTSSVESLENYAIVQYIKGCVYNETTQLDGAITRINNIAREFFGKYKKFSHTQWEIDTIDTDPIYNSSMLENYKSRHLNYRWNTVEGSIAEETEKFLLHELPLYPEIYVSDRPAQAYKDGNTVKSVNLEFNVCIYKTFDIPLILEPTDINFATPIKCVDWKHSKVFDHTLKKYVSNKIISETCPIID